jgi:hypothetical protein
LSRVGIGIDVLRFLVTVESADAVGAEVACPGVPEFHSSSQ